MVTLPRLCDILAFDTTDLLIATASGTVSFTICVALTLLVLRIMNALCAPPEPVTERHPAAAEVLVTKAAAERKKFD